MKLLTGLPGGAGPSSVLSCRAAARLTRVNQPSLPRIPHGSPDRSRPVTPKCHWLWIESCYARARDLPVRSGRGQAHRVVNAVYARSSGGHMTIPPPTPSGRPHPAPPAISTPPSGPPGLPVPPPVPDDGRKPANERPLDARPLEGRPLPDAKMVQLLAVPDSAPPYDDEILAAGNPPGGRATAMDVDVGTAGRDRAIGRATWSAPQRAADPATPQHDGRPAAPQRGTGPATPQHDGRPAAPQHDGRPAAPQRGSGPAAPQRGSGPAVPRPGGGAARTGCWPGQFAQVLAETLAGGRPPQQIMPWTTRQARRRIRELGPLLAARGQPRVCRVVTSSPAANVIEMTVVIRSGSRFRALAARLELSEPRCASPGRTARPARWLCTALEAA
jgi:Family of unknown function (DUF6459)